LPENTALEHYRQRKRGCIVKVLIAWFTMGTALVMLMIYTRGHVERDPERIRAFADTLVTMDLPQGFYPYSMTHFENSWFFFPGLSVISYWDAAHVREDGRPTSVISLFSDQKWQKQNAAAVEADMANDLTARLERVEFHSEDHSREQVTVNGETFTIFRFTGTQALDADLVKATSCFRFLQGPRGPIQVQTLGLEENFPAERQIATLATFKARPASP